MLDTGLVSVSAHRQAPAHHSPRAVQPDAGGGQRGAAEVPGLGRPHPLHQLAEGRAQSAGEGPAHVPAGAGQPADQERQGERPFPRARRRRSPLIHTSTSCALHLLPSDTRSGKANLASDEIEGINE